MTAGEIVLALVLQVVLIFLNAIFASAEIAVISANSTKMEKLAEDGNKRAKRICRLTKNSSKFLSTIQVAITLASLLGSAFAADSFSEPLTNAMIGAPGPENSQYYNVVSTIVMIVITLILSYFSIVFGELVPKRIAMRNAEKLSLILSGILTFVSYAFAPFVWLLTVSANGILRLIGIKPEDSGEEVTEEEIMLMAEAGSEKGSIDEKENEFIQNIFEFKENDVGEVCTHRKDVDFLFERDDPSVWEETIKQSSHTYYPVCGKDVDDVVGVLNTKIYFRLKDKSRENVRAQAVMPPVFISETMQADDLFYRMKTTREYFAVVLDEYGGINGIITIHDLIELLVGDLHEKGEAPDYEIKKTGEDTWEVTGLAPFDEVIEAMDIRLSEEEKAEDDYETFGGYVCEMLGEVPDDGTAPECENELVKVQVLLVEEHRIEKMRITKKQKPAESDGEDDDKKFRLFRKDREEEDKEQDAAEKQDGSETPSEVSPAGSD